MQKICRDEYFTDIIGAVAMYYELSLREENTASEPKDSSPKTKPPIENRSKDPCYNTIIEAKTRVIIRKTRVIIRFERLSKNGGTNEHRIDRRTRISWKSIEALASFQASSMHCDLSKQN